MSERDQQPTLPSSTERTMARKPPEIVSRLRSGRDFFGWANADLLEWLDFDHAKEFLRPEVTAEEWGKRDAPKPVWNQMVDYMPFAWDKANNCRGLSAGRSMDHYSNWLWLIGEDQLSESLSDYEYYGKDNLVRICEFLGLDPKQWDDGIRSNTEY